MISDNLHLIYFVHLGHLSVSAVPNLCKHDNSFLTQQNFMDPLIYEGHTKSNEQQVFYKLKFIAL